MILRASKRGGANQLAKHLLNEDVNEHIEIHEISGFMSDSITGALNEIYAISRGTQCTQFMFSLSLSPPKDEEVPVSIYEEALKKAEERLGLVGQPRVIVFHEKEGRRHGHCVWSRIDAREMKAIDQDFFKNKLNNIAKSLYLEHGWQMPEGFKDRSLKNPLNFTRAEWQQAKSTGRKAANIIRELQECWAASDSKKSFEHALNERGHYLARGDRRGFVSVDIYGKIHSLSKKLDKNKKELEARLGRPKDLPSVAETKDKISTQVSSLFKKYMNELSAGHNAQMHPLLHEKQNMTQAHQSSRKQLETFQKNRWQKEENKRAARIRSGFKGLWDKINGRYWKTRKRNEQETWKCYLRDQKSCEDIIYKQLTERQNLQVKIDLLRSNQEQDKAALLKDLAHINANEKAKEKSAPHQEKSLAQSNTMSDAYHNAHNGEGFKKNLKALDLKIAIGTHKQLVYVTDKGSIQSLVKNIENAQYKDIENKLNDLDRDKLPLADDIRAEIIDTNIRAFNGQMSLYWLNSNNGTEFFRALEKDGFTLAINDKENYVYVTDKGNIRSLPKNLDGGKGIYSGEINKRFSDLEGHKFIKIRSAQNVQLQIQQTRYGAYEKKIQERILESRKTWDIERLEKELHDAKKASQNNSGVWGKATRKQDTADNLRSATLNLETARTRLEADIKAINKQRPAWVIDYELQKQGFVVENTNKRPTPSNFTYENEHDYFDKEDHQNLNDFDDPDIDIEPEI